MGNERHLAHRPHLETLHVTGEFVQGRSFRPAALHISGVFVQESLVGRADGGGPEKRTARLDSLAVFLLRFLVQEVEAAAGGAVSAHQEVQYPGGTVIIVNIVV